MSITLPKLPMLDLSRDNLYGYTADQMHAHAAAVSAAKDAEIAALRDFVEHVRRNGSTHLAGMAIAVLAALEQKP